MDVHVRDLRYFVAIAEELNFTRAAARLFVSQPTLSKQIRALEQHLRTALFDRDRRSVVLTPAGHALLPHARHVIARWEAARQAVAAARDTVLTVGFQTRIGRGLIPAVTARMGAVLPDWRLRFRQVPWSDPSAGLASGDVDVAVTWLPVPDTGEYDWKVVSTEERWVALPADHPLAARTAIPFADLLHEPFLAHPASAGALRDFWLAADDRPTPARVVAEAENPDESFELVAAGVGVVLVPAENAETSPRADVVCRPVPGLAPSRLAVVWRTDDDREAVRVFADSCVRCLCGVP
ncbi:LysR family transcriptional regulator [Actinosynnema sp. NPDC020468]|uniref:LysR substrate-binding domain-containing protein n=1 Tax=Actinosynnema sp. NPDC020468 TaxID=3154488 RepID=UPI0033E3BADB